MTRNRTLGTDTPWASDFSYGYFRRLLEAARRHFSIHPLSDVPRILNPGPRPRLVLRHDVDVDLERARRMAEIEQGFGVRATYMVMLNSPLYELGRPSSRMTLRALASMGHEVGLHFDFDDPARRQAVIALEEVTLEVQEGARQLEALTERPVVSVSFHRPVDRLLRGPLHVGGLINAYAAALMRRYLSDSRGCWRAGAPLAHLTKPAPALLQMLIHPIWWGEKHAGARDRLQCFFESATRKMRRPQIDSFDAALAAHISVRRRGPAAAMET